MSSCLTSTAASVPRWLLLLAATAALGESEEKVSREEQLAQFRKNVDEPVVLRLPGMDEVGVRKDVVYKENPKLTADVYRPPKSAAGSDRPAVIFVHGGVSPDVPYRPKEWGIYTSWGRLVAASGFIGVTFNHRVGFPDPHLDDGASDLQDLIAFMRGHAAEFGIDKERLALIFYSAGGPLLSVPLRDHYDFVRCVIGFYPLIDIERTALHRQYMTADALTRFSPFSYLSRTEQWPPLLIARAGRDQIPDLLQGLDRFICDAVKANAPIEILNHPNGEHGFDNKPSARSGEIVTRALAFLREHLSPDKL